MTETIVDWDQLNRPSPTGYVSIVVKGDFCAYALSSKISCAGLKVFLNESMASK